MFSNGMMPAQIPIDNSFFFAAKQTRCYDMTRRIIDDVEPKSEDSII
jgi:hypothetical protein